MGYLRLLGNMGFRGIWDSTLHRSVGIQVWIEVKRDIHTHTHIYIYMYVYIYVYMREYSLFVAFISV